MNTAIHIFAAIGFTSTVLTVAVAVLIGAGLIFHK